MTWTECDGLFSNPNGDTDPGVSPRCLASRSGDAKLNLVVSDQLHEPPQIRLLLDRKNDEIVAVPLLVAQEQILHPTGRNVGPVERGILTGEDRWVVVTLEGDAEGIERRVDLRRSV